MKHVSSPSYSLLRKYRVLYAPLNVMFLLMEVG